MQEIVKTKLKYGKTYKKLKISPKNVIDILEIKKIFANENPYQLVKEKLNSPIGTQPLTQLIKDRNPQNLVIVVSDITRPFPYKELLKVLVEEIAVTGFNKKRLIFVIANGTHRKMTEKEIRSHFGNWIVDNFHFENHNCRADDLVFLGKMKSGNELWVNKTVASADFLITVGVLAPHYFAGFGGGRKSILPGICGYETIRRNHSNIILNDARLGKLKDNLIHLEMSEAADKVEVDFCINIIVNYQKEFVDCYIGDIDESFQIGVQALKKYYSTEFNQIADVVFTSAGGYHKDINFFLSQRALNNTISLVKNGGTIVLVTESREGIGQDEMERALISAKNLDDIFSIKQKTIQIGEHRAFATAKLLKKADILVVSRLKPEKVNQLHFIPMKSLKHCVDFIIKKHGENYKSYIVPDGSLFLPIEKNIKDLTKR